MKTTISAIALSLFLISQATAQLEAGRISINGSFSLGSHESDNAYKREFSTISNDDKYFNTNATTTVNYFIADRLSIGIGPGYYYDKREYISKSYNTDTNTLKSVNRTNTYSLGLVLSKYFSINEKWYFFTSLSGRYGIIDGDRKQVQTSNQFADIITEWKREGYSYGVSLTPGITYFINENLGISSTLGYITYGASNTKLKSETDYKSDTESNDLNVKLNLSSINLGFSYYF